MPPAKLTVIPNCTRGIPWLLKDKIVTEISGMIFPKASKIPVKSFDMPYLSAILSRLGKRAFS